MPDTPATPPEVKKCDNCGEPFEVNPKRRPDKGKNQRHRFCKTQCRIEFNRTGTSYPKVEAHITRIVSDAIGQHVAMLEKISKDCTMLEKRLRSLDRKLLRLRQSFKD